MVEDFENVDVSGQQDWAPEPGSRAAGSRGAGQEGGAGTSRRQPEGRNSRSRSGRKDKKRMSTTLKRIIVFAIAEVIALASIFSYAFVKKQYNKIQRPEVSVEVVRNQNLSIADIQKMEEGNWTVAIFGVDSRDSSVGKGNNADVIIIANINKDTGEIKLVSVFRDTYLAIGDGTWNKINAAYCNGGPEQALKALNEDLDLNITQYATFNWKAVVTAINILGGVDIELSKGEFYYINSFITETVQATKIGSVQLTHAGMNHLDGVQAVAYARLRLMDNDYARTERQRKVIELCFEKAKQADVKMLTSAVGVMLELVATNMGWQEGLDVVNNLSKYHMGDTGGFPFARGEAVMGKRGSCIIAQTLESNVRDLHQFLYGEEGYEPSDSVKNMSAKLSADSGMYSEGKAVGHVSTKSSYIPPSTTAAPPQTAAQTTAAESAAETSAALTDANGETIPAPSGAESGSAASESPSSGRGSTAGGPGVADTLTKVLQEMNLTGDGKEYAVSRDGYLVYADGMDGEGDTIYKYVLGDDGRRIRVTGSEETTAAAPGTTSEAESTSAGTTTAASGNTTGPTAGNAGGPGGTSPTQAERPSAPSSQTETTPVQPGSQTETTAAQPGGITETVPGSTPAETTAVHPGMGTTAAQQPVAPGTQTETTAGQPGAPGSMTETTAAQQPVAPGSGTTAAPAETVENIPGSGTAGNMPGAPVQTEAETIPAGPGL